MTAEPTDRRIEVHPGKEALVRFAPDRTFTCVDSCTWCCHHGVMLYEPDLFALAEHASLADTTAETRGTSFVETTNYDRDDHVDANGHACHFLDGDGQCGLYAANDWKPTRCSVFPLEVLVENGEIVVDIREDAETHCEGLDVEDRRLIDHLDAFLPPILWELDDPRTKRAV